MKFGTIATAEALGALLAHSVMAGERKLAKGSRLGPEDIAILKAAGIESVIAARLDEGDLTEDVAAGRIARAIPRDHLTFSPASTGRVNVFAAVNGLFRARRDVVDRLNRIDPAITLACLDDYKEVKAGDMVATFKIIPLAVSGAAVERAERLLAAESPFEVKAFTPRNVALIATELPTLKSSVMDKTRRLLEARLEPSGSRLAVEYRVPHRAEAVAEKIGASVADHGLVVVFGASAVVDSEDVIPAAIRLAGGTVEQVGVPVDPGNLLVLGHVGGVPVLGAPGCARSPKENAFDWVLARLFAGEEPDSHALTGLGVGGLLMEIPSRPRPRLAGEGVARRDTRVAAVILAAGKASRMGTSGRHKLLARFDGEPLVRRSAAAVLSSAADTAVIVTGHRADEIETAIGGLGIRAVRNPDYETGMASSLKAGLAAVEEEKPDGLLVVLADMPGITASDLNTLIAAFRREGGRAVIRATSGGKRGNPVILPASTFPEIMRLEGDIGARPIIEESGLKVVDVELGEKAHLDTDTPEEILAAGGVLAG